jgi:hypothetical protein
LIVYAFSFVFPFLLTLAVLQRLLTACGARASGWLSILALAPVSAAIVLVPIKGLPVARWLLSVNANFSIPLTAVLFSWVWERAWHRQVLDGKGYRACWIFGLIAGLGLYPMALGWGPFDPYSLGWEFSILFVLLMAATILLLLYGNRFGIVLLVAVFAYNLGLLESRNLWDYVVDPFYALASLVYVGYEGVRALFAGSRKI